MNDPFEGVIRDLEGETLETYCKADRCPLYFTKSGVIPPEYLALLEAGNHGRESRLAGRPPNPRLIESWRWRSYLITEYARRLIQMEKTEKQLAEQEDEDGQSTPGSRLKGKGRERVTNTIREQMKASDSGAFNIPFEQEDDEA